MATSRSATPTAATRRSTGRAATLHRDADHDDESRRAPSSPRARHGTRPTRAARDDSTSARGHVRRWVNQNDAANVVASRVRDSDSVRTWRSHSVTGPVSAKPSTRPDPSQRGQPARRLRPTDPRDGHPREHRRDELEIDHGVQVLPRELQDDRKARRAPARPELGGEPTRTRGLLVAGGVGPHTDATAVELPEPQHGERGIRRDARGRRQPPGPRPRVAWGRTLRPIRSSGRSWCAGRGRRDHGDGTRAAQRSGCARERRAGGGDVVDEEHPGRGRRPGSDRRADTARRRSPAPSAADRDRARAARGRADREPGPRRSPGGGRGRSRGRADGRGRWEPT